MTFTLQSECPHTIMCLMSFTIHPSSNAAGSFVVASSRKCCEWGIKLPALRTVTENYIVCILCLSQSSTVHSKRVVYWKHLSLVWYIYSSEGLYLIGLKTIIIFMLVDVLVTTQISHTVIQSYCHEPNICCFIFF
jgi:hypothetical protein